MVEWVGQEKRIYSCKQRNLLDKEKAYTSEFWSIKFNFSNFLFRLGKMGNISISHWTIQTNQYVKNRSVENR